MTDTPSALSDIKLISPLNLVVSKGSNWSAVVTIATLLISSFYAANSLIIFPSWTVDDAYITFRYAENLAIHGELTWNVGEDPIEGYTGIALPLLLAGLMKVDISPILASDAIGLLSYMLSAVMLFLLAGRLGVRKEVCAGIVLLFVTAPFLLTHTFSGLETMLFTAMILITLFQLHRTLTSISNRSTLRTATLCFLLTSLVRPEGVLVAALAMLIITIVSFRQSSQDGWSVVGFFALWYLLPAAAYFTWRWNYYGWLLPNTYYAKIHSSGVNGQSLQEFWQFWKSYGRSLWYGILLLAAAILFWRGRCVEVVRRFLNIPMVGVIVVSLLFLSGLAYQYFHSNLLMNYSHRFFLPWYPLVLLAFALSVQLAISMRTRLARRQKFWWSMAVFGVVTIVSGHQFSMQIRNINREHSETILSAALLDDIHIPIGKMLREELPRTSRLAVYFDAGTIPYYSKLPTIDFGGLNDETLPHISNDPKTVTEYFFTSDPDVAVFTSYDTTKVVRSETSDMIISDPRFLSYTLLKVFSSERVKDYSEFVFLRQELSENENKINPE